MKANNWLALLLALTMVFTLAACGKEEAGTENNGKSLETSTDYTGDWICVRMEEEGLSMSIRDMNELDEGEVSMSIAADGTLTLDGGDVTTGTWAETDTGIEFTAGSSDEPDADKLAFTHDVAADTLSTDVVDGYIMVFARKGSQAETESRNTNYLDLEDALSNLEESEEYPQVTLAVGTPSTTVFTGETLDAKVYGTFIAQKPGDYTFWAESGQDSYATLYRDAEHTDPLAAGDDENGTNFVITCTLAKAETVYLEAGLYFTNNGKLTIQVAPAAAAPVSIGGTEDSTAGQDPAADTPVSVTDTPISVAEGETATPESTPAPAAALPEGFVPVKLEIPAVAIQQDFFGYAHGMFTAGQAGTYAFTAQSDADVSLYLYDNADCGGDPLGYADDNLSAAAETLTLDLQAGQVVYLESSYWGDVFPAHVTFNVALADGQVSEPVGGQTAALASAPTADGGLAIGSPVTLTTSAGNFYGHTSFTAPYSAIYLFTASCVEDCSLGLYEDANCWYPLGYVDDGLQGDTECLAIELGTGETIYVEVYIYSAYGDVVVAVSSN